MERLKKKMKYGIGIDIGGTKISVVLGTQKGKILLKRKIPTLKNNKIPECVRHLKSSIAGLIRESGVRKKAIKGIGVGVPGAVDPRKGTVPLSPNLQGWKGFPLRRTLEREFDCPVFMTNDANAAVLGERLFGQGRGKKNVLYITVSTGIGGGIIVNDQLVQGASFVAGEIGHMVIVNGGRPCNCGQRGCLEAYASGTAIAKFYRNELNKMKGKRARSNFSQNKSMTAAEVGMAARKGNRLALQSVKMAGNYLGVGIGSLLNILNPQVVILGGGVLKSVPGIYWKVLRDSTRKHSWPQAHRAAKIVRTRLGDEVGNLGALALVFSHAV